MLLGEGGFGKVFEGWFEDRATPKNGSGTVVAVKKLNSESLQGLEEWQVRNPTHHQTPFHLITGSWWII